MATKKTAKKSKARKGAGDRKDNHITGHSRTACYRLSLGMYEAVQSHAEANGVSTGKQALRWLIAGAKKDGVQITPETLAFAGL